VSYLKATGFALGLLINFGAGSLEVRRKVRELHSDRITGLNRIDRRPSAFL
jgi:hypothetical protein